MWQIWMDASVLVPLNTHAFVIVTHIQLFVLTYMLFAMALLLTVLTGWQDGVVVGFVLCDRMASGSNPNNHPYC